MQKNKIDMPFLILDKYAQLIDMNYFLYNKKDLDDALRVMSHNRFLKEYTFQQKIAKDALSYQAVTIPIISKYKCLVDILDNLKIEFNLNYPVNKYPEYYL